MIPHWYPIAFKAHQPYFKEADHLFLALSAGVDSNLLLHFLAHYREQLPPIETIHVNHNWHGEYSHLWANFARTRAEFYGFTHHHFEYYFQENDPRSIEAAGREERYKIFGDVMKKSGAKNPLLLAAHHRSDQAETFFQRLLRGSGVRGLGAMRPLSRVTFGQHKIGILRPLLSYSKRELYQAATLLNIPWLEDYTNHEVDQLSRNIIRNDLFPQIERHFPHYEASIARAADHLQESYQLLSEIAAEDLSSIIEANSGLNIERIRALSPARQKNLINYWLNEVEILPSHSQLEELFSTFIERDAPPSTLFSIDRWQLRIHQGVLYRLNLEEIRTTKSRYKIEWRPALNAPPLHFWESQNVVITPREAGIRFHPLYRHRSQSLKKLLQELKIPQWERENLQMIKNGKGEILWIEHVGLSALLEEQITAEGVLPIIKMLP